jgi:hypothetical protein
MNNRGAFFLLFTLVLMLAVTLPAANASTTNQETKLTFSQDVAIPGQVLPAGTYLFVLADDSESVVHILSTDRSKVYATLNTVASIREHQSGDIAVSFAERASGQPDAILTWFYPGMLEGHEFIYSKQEEREFVSDSKLVVNIDPSDRETKQIISGD